MYVVWRGRPVKGRDGGPFLLEPNIPSGDRSLWKEGLACRHRGEGRTAWTPLVIASERVDGKPRQRVLHRFPTIRTCCIADQFNRAAWWHEVNFDISTWAEWVGGTDRFRLETDLSRDRAAMLAKLRQVVPPPTAQGKAAFDAYYAEKEHEAKARSEAEREWWWTKGPGAEQREQRERAEADGWKSRGPFDFSYVEFNKRREAGREQQEQARRVWEEFQSTFGFGSGAGAGFNPGATADCYAVLGIEPTASAEEIKTAFRELAKVHHPDKGGDAATFNQIRAAYERAMGRVSRASA